MYALYFSSDVLKEVDQALPDAPEETPENLTMLTYPNTPPHRLDLKVNTKCTCEVHCLPRITFSLDPARSG
ncbi:hypothetical protein BDR04DRAFT_1163099 [Suillus decipiens]|nr:hypothetical protein BDR04DRAFT_1163099 [Suillus decipiens]